MHYSTDEAILSKKFLVLIYNADYLFIYATFIKRSIHKQICSNALYLINTLQNKAVNNLNNNQF